ncbi:MAG: ATP-binding protein [Planctomycetota bacterium]
MAGAELTRQMLAYAGVDRTDVRSLDLNVLIAEVTHLLKSAISRNATVSFNLANDLPKVQGDSSQLRQVMMNLVTNASDAIGDAPGEVCISSGTSRLTEADIADMDFHEGLQAGPFVWFEVADDGCGMAPETKANIFDPFFTTKFTGRGLGLAAVLGILRAHAAGVRITSRPGSGSVFRVFLSPDASTAHPESRPVEETRWRGSGLVLIVDDNTSARTVCSRMVERLGFSVITCEDGVEAVDAFRQHHESLRLVMLDLTMPRLGGAGAFEQMMAINPRIPVLLCSGYTNQDGDPRFDHPSLKAFVRKPYRIADLARTIEEALSA